MSSKVKTPPLTNTSLDQMPTIDPTNPKGRATSGTDERGITMPPETLDRMPDVPAVKPRIQASAQVILASNDVGSDYLQARQDRVGDAQVDSFMSWVNADEPGGELEPFPTDQKPPENQSTVGKVVRNVAEIPTQAIGGFGDAVVNALGVLNPLTDWLNENVADLRYDPTVPAPKTATGRVTRSFSTFLTGFIPLMKGMRAAGITGNIVAPTAAGGLADLLVRNPQEKRLSDAWQEAGLPPNILTDYLSSDPEDSAMEGRFKNALEGVIVGGATNTLFSGIAAGAKALRGLKHAQAAGVADDAAQKALEAAKVQYGELTDDQARTLLGDSKLPLVQVGDKVAAGLKATTAVRPAQIGVEGPKGGEVFINFARIDGPEQVKGVMDDLAQRFAPSIKESTRGVITQEETKRMAAELGLSLDDLLARRSGQPLNAETAFAARRMWAASAENLLATAEKAAAPNAGQVDQFAFRRALATHYAIQAEVIGARTETARALASWRIPAGGGVEKAMALQQAIEASGGSKASAEMAAKLVQLSKTGHLGDGVLAGFAERGWGAKAADAIQDVWINGLLMNPTTWAVNAQSNLIVAYQQAYERGVAGMLAKATGGEVVPGEASAMLYADTHSFRDALRLAWKAFKTGEGGHALGKIDIRRPGGMSAEALGIAGNTTMGRAVDIVGSTFRIGGGRVMVGTDEFFKTIAYRRELYAQALRQGTQEGLAGPELGRRMTQLITAPTEAMRIQATEQALYSTFTQQPGWFASGALRLRNSDSSLGRSAMTLIFPFIRTPANIMRYTFERTPLAPLVGQWRADMLAGGARADLALARTATGTALMLMALDMADSGQITGSGPQDPGEREAMTRQGWRPNSIKVGDRFYSYSRTDPIGALWGVSSNIAQAIRQGEMNEDDVDQWQEVLAMGIFATSDMALNKTYLRGMSEAVEVMSDPTRYGEAYISNMLGSFVPMTSLSGAVARQVDPVMRERNTPWDAVEAKIAFLSKGLQPKLNLWGEEMRYESGLGKGYDFFSPIQAGPKVTPSPVDMEIMRLAPIGAADNIPGTAPKRITKSASFQGVRVNFKDWPEIYTEYVKLAGNDLKHPVWKQGCKDFLNDIVTRKNPLSKIYYDLTSDANKLAWINNTIAQYRDLAQQEVMKRHPDDFAPYVQALQSEKRRALTPPILQGVQ